MKKQPTIQSVILSVSLLLSLLAVINPGTSEAKQWLTTEWKVLCVDPVDCEPANHVMAEQLIKASQWLEGLGFEAPSSYSNLELGDAEFKYYVAKISDAKVAERKHLVTGFYDINDELIWLSSDDYFSLGKPGQQHSDDMFKILNLPTVISVHELFHAVQHADAYYLPVNKENSWIREGTAVAVQMDYALLVEPDTDSLFMSGQHTTPLHQPEGVYGKYMTAGFWLFVGNKLHSQPRTAYLDQLLRNKLLAQGSGIAGIDDYLKDYGGLYKMFPMYLASLPVTQTFGEPDAWRLQLSKNQTSTSKKFSAKVNQLAGDAARLTVSHQSEQAVEVHIAFEGDHSDLHLIVNGELQVFGPAGLKNVYTAKLKDNKETLDIVVAEVAQDATESVARDYAIKVTLKEVAAPPCGFHAVVGGGVPMAGIHEGPARKLGNLVVLSDPKTGWEARVEIPGKSVGSYDTSFQAAAFIVDHPNCPGCVEFWQSDDAKMKITAIDTDRKTGFAEGNFSGTASWKGSGDIGEYTPFKVTVKEFRALNYSVREKGALQACVDYWRNR